MNSYLDILEANAVMHVLVILLNSEKLPLLLECLNFTLNQYFSNYPLLSNLYNNRHVSAISTAESSALRLKI